MECPLLTACVFTRYGASLLCHNTQIAIVVRIPFYHMVYTVGTHLPYFDRIRCQMVADPEVLLLKDVLGVCQH